MLDWSSQDGPVLELGSGLGLVSMVMAHLTRGPVWASERPIALPLLRLNIERNNSRVDPVELEWESTAIDPGASAHLSDSAVLLGADLTFPSNAHLFRPLLAIVRHAAASGATVFLSHEVRDPQIEAAFFDELRATPTTVCRVVARHRALPWKDRLLPTTTQKHPYLELLDLCLDDAQGLFATEGEILVVKVWRGTA
jgi:predicted nicotinamide N-methyase